MQGRLQPYVTGARATGRGPTDRRGNVRRPAGDIRMHICMYIRDVHMPHTHTGEVSSVCTLHGVLGVVQLLLLPSPSPLLQLPLP